MRNGVLDVGSVDINDKSQNPMSNSENSNRQEDQENREIAQSQTPGSVPTPHSPLPTPRSSPTPHSPLPAPHSVARSAGIVTAAVMGRRGLGRDPQQVDAP